MGRLVLALTLLFSWYVVPSAAQSIQIRLQRDLQFTAENLRKRLPLALDDITTLVSVDVIGLTVYYINEVDQGVDAKFDKSYIQEELTRLVCQARIGDAVRGGAKLVYRYVAKQDRSHTFAEIVISSCTAR